mgnify:CR=1 FL=1
MKKYPFFSLDCNGIFAETLSSKYIDIQIMRGAKVGCIAGIRMMFLLMG